MPAAIEVNDEHVRQCEAAAAAGLSHAQISDLLGWSEATFRRKKKAVQALGEAYRRGRAKLATKLGEAAVTRALAGSDRLLIFLLKCQFGWSEEHGAPAYQDERDMAEE